MTPTLIISVILGYFLVLVAISWFTSRGASNDSFFLGNKKSPWFVVAFGMIGASLSGVTFISVPGWVGTSHFTYMQVVWGYLIGYAIIAFVLMPLYYRLNLTSIYKYLETRFGYWTYKTGASFFLLSRILGAAGRLFLVAIVLQEYVFDDWGVPFELTVAISIALIWVYTFRGGIKTIIWTDTLQTLFMLLALGFSIVLIADSFDLSFGKIVSIVADTQFSDMLQIDDFNARNHFIKNFIAGIFLAVCMTGLDQDMMQKNLSCKNIGSAQKNMVSFSIVLVVVNFVFLFLGALLFAYAGANNIAIPAVEVVNELGETISKAQTDLLYPEIALNGGFGIGLGIVFLLGLVAAAYSSADSALTALTTSVCVDFLDIEKKPQEEQIRTRKRVHIIMSVVLLIAVIIFKYTADKSVIYVILKWAGFTYGPLLGMYAFGVMSKRKILDIGILVVCPIAIGISILLDVFSMDLFNGFQFGFEIIVVNGFLTFVGIWILSLIRSKEVASVQA